MGQGFARLPRVVEVTYEKFHLHGDPEFLARNLDEIYTLDFVREDRRRLVGAPTANREEFVQQLRGWHGISHGPPQFSVEEIVAVRGERCILIRARVLYADTWSEFLSVGRIDADDRTDRSVLFDPDDIESAIAELDRMFAEIS